MPSRIGRNLHLCFTKIKRPAPPNTSHPTPKQDHNRPLTDSAAALTTASILIKNFNTLYDHHHHHQNTFESTTTTTTTTNSKSLISYASTSDDFSTTSSSASDDTTTTPDFSTVFTSQRFFFSSPGRSNSIIESSPPPSTASPEKQAAAEAVVDGGVAIPTYSPDPYKDFRRSMEEMVEARELRDVRENWDCLHELLNCYLSLNPKSTHKFIVSAFADLLITLL